MITRKSIRSICIMFGVIILFSILCMILLTGCETLPTWKANEHVAQSYETFALEGAYPFVYGKMYDSLDNVTDATMLARACYSHEEARISPVESAVFGYQKLAKGTTYAWHSFAMQYWEGDSGETIDSPYSHYWHGYVLFLKPLLILFNYNQIRIVYLVVQTVMVLACLFILARKKKLRPFIPAFITLFLIQDIRLTSMSLQFSTVFYIYLIGTIILLLFYDPLKRKNILPYFFLSLGMVTAFFDFLTYPLVTYGIPVTVFLILEDEEDMVHKLKHVVLFGLCWIFGYAGMLISKPIVGSLLVRENLLIEFFNSLFFRIESNNYSEFTRLNAVVKNLVWFTNTRWFPFAFTVMFSAIIIVFVRMTKKHSKAILKGCFSTALPFLLISVSPVCWFFVLSNHVYIHTFFAHKALYITVFALACLLTKIYTRVDFLTRN